MKTVLVTGASSGIGFETAKQFYLSGWNVIIVAENQTALRQAAERIQKNSLPNKLEQYAVDLSLIQARVQFVNELLQVHSTIDVLINNAGAIYSEFKLNSDGLERTIALNYFAGAHLSLLLLPTLLKSTNGKIINITSDLYNIGKLDFASFEQEPNLKIKKKKASITLRQRILYVLLGRFQLESYAQSKLAVMLYTAKLAKKYTGSPLKVLSFHPKMVQTNITKNGKGLVYKIIWPILNFLFAQTPKGPAKILFSLSQQEVKTGSYFVMKERITPNKMYLQEKDSKVLWEKTLKRLNLPDEYI